MRLRVMVGVVCVVVTAVAGAPAARAATPAPAFGESASPGGRGYVLLGADGGMFAFGGARFFGRVQNCFADAGCSSIASTPTHDGYYVAGDGCTIIGRGNAHQLGTPPRVGIGAGCRIALAPFGIGYWLAASDGGVFACGDARFSGSAAGLPLQAPVRDIIPG